MENEIGTLSVWAVVELMGHIRIAGMVTEENHFGGTIGRVDIPTDDEKFVTQYFGASALFRLTPCSEDTARIVAYANKPNPIHLIDGPRGMRIDNDY